MKVRKLLRFQQISILFVLCLFVLIFSIQSASAQLSSTQQDAIKYIKELEGEFKNAATKIWENPEPSSDEFISAGVLIDYLEKHGFEVEKEVVEGLGTSFVGTYGKGKPIIGILAEFDALPGLSQKAGIYTKEPIIEGAPGHGCGHHIYGSASVTAAIALAKTLEQHNISGTVKLFGTPGEESYSGKAFMAAKDLFDELDVCLAWHTGTGPTGAQYETNSGNISFNVKYYGKASHAARLPMDGRSALDGYELMSIGVQYMREHMIPGTTIHNIVTSGGSAANIVPDYVSAWYYVRNPFSAPMVESFTWVKEIAEAAAKMSQTKVEVQILKSAYNILPIKSFVEITNDVVHQVGPPPFTSEDQAKAEEVRKLLGYEPIEEPLNTKLVTPDFSETYPDMSYAASSSDTGNVSWRTPTVSINVAAYVEDTIGHNWQMVAQGLTDWAFKGGLQASKYIAATALELIANPELIDKIQNEFKEYSKKYAFEDVMVGVPVFKFVDLYGYDRHAIPGRIPEKEVEYWEKYGLKSVLEESVR